MATASLLEQMTTDLTSLAQQGKLDSVVGRDAEIAQLIEILSRPENNCAVLVGDREVGTTAVVEGLAIRISEGAVPEKLINKSVRQLDVSYVVRGNAYPGKAVERTSRLIEALSQSDNSILFMDDLFLSWVGDIAQSPQNNLETILKTAVREKKFLCVVRLTPADFKKWQELSPNLSRQFQPIEVNEPSIEVAIQMLEGVRKIYEEHHLVKINHDALEAAVRLSVKFVQNRKLPDKAIDLMDEGAANLRTSKLPATFRGHELKREISRLENFLRDPSPLMAQSHIDANRKRKSELEAELAALQPQIDAEPKDLQLTTRDIAEVVAKWTDRPVSEILSSIETP